jgi:hypothetical protein
MTDKPLQPTDHHLFVQRSFIETNLNGKPALEPTTPMMAEASPPFGSSS